MTTEEKFQAAVNVMKNLPQEGKSICLYDQILYIQVISQKPIIDILKVFFYFVEI